MLSFSRTTRCISSLRMRNPKTNHQVNITPLQMYSVSAKEESCPLDRVDPDNKATAKPFNALPGPGGIYNIPFIGFLFHLKPFGNHTIEQMHRLLDEMVREYGSIFKVQLNVPGIVISDPKDIATVLRSEGKYPFRPNLEIFDVYYKRSNKPANLSTLQGPEWWKLRAPIQRMLMRPKQLSQYLPMMNAVADDFVEVLTKDTDFIKSQTTEEAFMAYFAESAGQAFFNKRLGFLDKVQSEETKNMQKATLDLFEILFSSAVGGSNAFRFYRSKDYRKFEWAANYLHQMSKKYVTEAKESLDTKKESGQLESEEPNMLRTLLQDLTVDDAALIMDGLYTAAVDSSAAGLQIILYTLAKHPDKQEILREEITSVLSNDDKDVTQEHLDKMPYLKACLKEVYRSRGLIPLGPSRVLPEDVVIGGYHVPAKTLVFIYTGMACHDDNLFENPEEFVPERWLRQNKRDENGQGGRTSKGNQDNSWAVLPFGMGKRGCPGRRLFEQELYLIVAKLLQKTTVGLSDESRDTEFEYRLFWKPSNPLKFTFTPDVEERSF